jgi:hypothetical protein
VVVLFSTFMEAGHLAVVAELVEAVVTDMEDHLSLIG